MSVSLLKCCFLHQALDLAWKGLCRVPFLKVHLCVELPAPGTCSEGGRFLSPGRRPGLLCVKAEVLFWLLSLGAELFGRALSGPFLPLGRMGERQ